MKIDESCINHNVVRLIEEITANIYECNEEEHNADRLVMLGEINGVLNLANELKKVLKA